MGLVSGALIAAATKLSTTVVADLYEKLKARLSQKSDADPGLQKAIERLEADPTNAKTAATVDALAAEFGLDQDPEVQKLADSIHRETNITASRRDTADVSGIGNKVAMGGSQIIEH